MLLSPSSYWTFGGEVRCVDFVWEGGAVTSAMEYKIVGDRPGAVEVRRTWGWSPVLPGETSLVTTWGAAGGDVVTNNNQVRSSATKASLAIARSALIILRLQTFPATESAL